MVCNISTTFNIIWTIGNIVLLILIIIFAVYLFYKRVEQKSHQYREYNRFAGENAIVFVGDSLTEFYHLHEYFPDYHIINRGIAGDTTTGLLRRIKSNVLDIKPQKVFLQIGTNDFFKFRKIGRILKNIINITNIIKDALPNASIFLISLYPINKKRKWYYKLTTFPRDNRKINKLNELLIQHTQNNRITYIDINNHLKDNKGNLRAEYTIDGLHINTEGYEVITNILKHYIP